MLQNSQLKEMQIKADLTDELIQILKEQLVELSAHMNIDSLSKRLEKLNAENKKLEAAVLKSKEELIKLQEKNGIEQIPLPSSNKTSENAPKRKESKKANKENRNTADKENRNTTAKIIVKKEIDFGRLDLRVGKIIAVDDHPNAEKLFIETIDLGEKEPRRIISGIRSYYTKEQLFQQKVICLCNLKPAKLRGEMSFGMLICATGENGCVEILQPPDQANAGDFVVVAGNERHPDKELIPSEKVFETIVKDLKINAKKTLLYKNEIVEVKGNVCGPITTKTLVNSIKVG